jgi:photosystem II stability/assembly factor-like uncharacterized protein
VHLRVALPLLVVSAALLPTDAARSQSIDPAMYSTLQYRLIGPFRGGRTVGVAGIPDRPNTFYVGVNNGGVWKTTDAGRTWHPIFDSESTGSIGAIAIAPSNPDIIYVGSGEGLRRPDLSTGNGIYKSTDAGTTWRHLGLRDGQQIASIIVDPTNPDRVFVAVLGHPYGPNPERGIFRSTDGGKTWTKILYRDENTGGVDLAFDPANPQIVYAAMWASRRGPWTAANPYDGDGSGLFKSIDGGNSWRQLTHGLPGRTQGLGRIGFTIAPTDHNRMYALVDAKPDTGGLYRSDDAGESWTRVNHEERIWGRGNDFAWLRVDPRNANELYVCNTSLYRSMSGGMTFTAIKGAPGGDDYHSVWINPLHPDILLLGVDQGATISVNGGQTWSSWYNQPTAAFYHVATDNRFPYRVYGGQQESGSAAVSSRGNDGAITFREFHPVGTEEYGYVAPDPLDTNIVFGGKTSRFDWTTGQTQNVSPEPVRSGTYRFDRTAPLIFSHVDPHTLFLGSNVLFRTRNGGQSWDIISPDLTRDDPPVPATFGEFAAADPAHGHHRGVIYSIAPSYRDANVIWVGTDEGLIHVTRDGGARWSNVTPPAITPWSKIAQLDASHFDDQTVYAAVNRFRLDDLRPHIYRTHDGGSTWKEIVAGLPVDAPVNVVREDPVRRGLLFAGTETTVYVSFDDGDHWQSLRQNLPATSIRDLVVKDSDLVVATHGRSFWIMDDIAPLRQLDASVATKSAHLFAPAGAVRVQRDTYTDTPLPPEEPAGQNPPDGAIIDYYIGAAARDATLDILDARGNIVRHFSSSDLPQVTDAQIEALDVPSYWIRRPRILSASAGMHRWIWNLHYPDPSVVTHEYPISAIPHDTPRLPLGPSVLPATYTVRLTVSGKSYTQPLVVRMDPRVRATSADLQQQFDIAMRIAAMIDRDFTAIAETRSVLASLDSVKARTDISADLRSSIDTLRARIGALGITRVNGQLSALLQTVDGVDARPTTQTVAAVAAMQRSLDSALSAWNDLKGPALNALNDALKTAGLHAITVPPDLAPYRETLQRGETADKDREEP